MQTISNRCLFCIEFDQVSTRNFKTNPLACFHHFTGRNTFGFDPVGNQVRIQLFQRRLVEHFETKEVDTGMVSLTEYHAMVIALIPALQVDTSLSIASGFNKTQHVTIVANTFFKVEYTNLSMSWT